MLNHHHELPRLFLQVLLSLGASPDYKDRRGLTPLYHTVLTGGDTSCCETLLYHRAKLGIRDENGWDETHQVRSGDPDQNRRSLSAPFGVWKETETFEFRSALCSSLSPSFLHLHPSFQPSVRTDQGTTGSRGRKVDAIFISIFLIIIHTFINSFIHPSIDKFIYQLWFIHSFVHSSFYPFFHKFIPQSVSVPQFSFAHSYIHPLTCS